MDTFYQILILSNNEVSLLNNNYKHIDKPVLLLNNNEIELDNAIISFDYLIFDDPKLIINFNNCNILHDDGIPVTNFFKCTSVENIFYTNDIFNTINDIENETF